MAILGLGTDICEISRIEDALTRLGERFAKRILTEQELTVWREKKQSSRFLAKRFAAKEAASKALGTGIACGVTFHDFTVLNNEYGKPTLYLSGKACELAQAQGIQHVHISLSDERRYAMATVILEN